MTGEIREYETDAILEDGEETPSTFIWAEGNYSCDCNRHIFFQRAKGEEDGGWRCGDERYSVQLVNPVTGRAYYDELGNIAEMYAEQIS